MGLFKLWGWLLNQSWCLRGILFPLPTHHLPSLSLGLSNLIIFLQTHDWCGLGEQSWMDPLGKYFVLKVLATKEFRFWLILQYCLANIAWFIRLNLSSPNPPQDLGQQILFQLSKCNFLTPWAWPHQKALTIESIFLQIVSGTLKQENVYKGRVWRIEAIRVVLPAWERRFAFHPYSLDWSLSTRNWKYATLLPLSLKFRPRYLLGFCTKFTLSCLARHSCSSLDMFREQKRSDFSKLMLWPERWQYQSRIPFKFVKDWLSFLKKNKKSSANSRWVK